MRSPRPTKIIDGDGHIFEDNAGIIAHMESPYREIARRKGIIFPPLDHLHTARAVEQGEVSFLLRQHRQKIVERTEDRETHAPAVAVLRPEKARPAAQYLPTARWQPADRTRPWR